MWTIGESDVGGMRRTYPSSTPPWESRECAQCEEEKKLWRGSSSSLIRICCVLYNQHSRSHSLDRHTSKIASRLSLARRESMTSQEIEWSFVFLSFSISHSISSTSASNRQRIDTSFRAQSKSPSLTVRKLARPRCSNSWLDSTHDG